MSSVISFSGLSTGIDTAALISAILEQESVPLTRLQTRLSTNTSKASVLSTLSTDLSALSTSMNSLISTAFESQAVTSSDSDGTHVTATANSSATIGSYDIQVGQLATKAKQTFGASSQSASVGTGTYAIEDVDGETHTFSLDSSNDSLTGLRDAINSSGADVEAKIVDTGTKDSSTRYQLVLTAKSTGMSDSGRAVFTVAQTSGSNTLGIASGTLDSDGALTSGGTDAATKAQDAVFWVDGLQLTRASNTVTDAVDGLTLTLKSGGQTASSTATTLTVATDTDGITKALQDVVDKFNAVWEVYKENAQYETTTSSTSTSTSGSDTTPSAGVLAGDQTIRQFLSSVRSTLISVAGGASGSGYTSSAQFGLKTNRDGTISLDTSALKSALGTNADSVKDVCYQVNTALQSAITKITSPGSGTIAMIRQQIESEDSALSLRIESTEARLARRKSALETEYSNLEATISSLKSASSSLSSITSTSSS